MVRKAVQVISHPRTNLYDKTKSWVGSRTFFLVVIALLIVQAGWIAVRSSYPLAFDEGYHLGIIQLYAHQWSPFFAHLPASTGQFGALATDPSYLYHYLMSFPYRLVTMFTDSTFVIVITLRFINIAFFAVGILLFRKVLKFTGASSALINLVLLAFVLLPLESFTAAQINYDTLLFPVAGATLLYALRFMHELTRRNRFDAKSLAALAVSCLLGTQVKYVFMPIGAAVVLFVAYVTVRWWLKGKRQAGEQVRQGIGKLSLAAKVLLISALVVSGGLFGMRYGYNIAKYHSFVPKCEQVLSVQACSAYAPWARNYQLSLQHTPAALTLRQSAGFAKTWLHIMGDELFTVLNGAKGGAMEQPVRQLVLSATLIALVGLPVVLLQARRLLKIGYPLGLFATVCITYIGALWYQNYTDFVHYGMPLAVQGRYLLPVLLLLMVVGAQAYSLALHKAPEFKAYLLIAALVMSLQGGGIITYLLRTNSSWYWDGAAQAHMSYPIADITASKHRT